MPEVDSSFTVLNKRGSKAPVIWITPDERQFPLFRQIDRERPIVCLQGRPQRADAPPDSFEQIGRRYQKDVFSLLPRRSYIVVGFCVFAAVAREVAAQLAHEGASVHRLVMIDPPDPAESLLHFDSDPPLARAGFTLNRALFHLQQMVDSGAAGLPAYIRGILASQSRRRVYGEGRDAHRTSLELGRSMPPQFRDNHRASISAFWSSTPTPYRGDTAIVRPLQVPKGAHRFPNLRWQTLLPGALVFHQVHGTSDSMWQQPHVRALAGLLTELFDTAIVSDDGVQASATRSYPDAIAGSSRE